MKNITTLFFLFIFVDCSAPSQEKIATKETPSSKVTEEKPQQKTKKNYTNFLKLTIYKNAQGYIESIRLLNLFHKTIEAQIEFTDYLGHLPDSLSKYTLNSNTSKPYVIDTSLKFVNARIKTTDVKE